MILVIGVAWLVLTAVPQNPAADPVHEIVVTIVAKPVGLLGLAGLNVKLLVIVTLQVIVAAPPPRVPALLH